MTTMRSKLQDLRFTCSFLLLMSLLILIIGWSNSEASEPSSSETSSVATSTQSLFPIVRTDRGYVLGVQQGSVVSFKGIPYAKPPVGNLRWAAPQPADPWTNLLYANSFGPRCSQPASLSDTTVIGNEDCLTINVWTSAPSAGANVPVIVYIHGGANLIGGSDWYDFTQMASIRPSVIVSLNYRLGPLGFLGHPALAAEDPNHSTGNYGILDQVAALQWVQRNISRFGGDPNQVLLSGQSAGAHDTLMHIASPLSSGLFSSAFAMSHSWWVQPLAVVQNTARVFQTYVGCDGADDVVACMRSQSAQLVTSAPGNGNGNLSFDPSCAPNSVGCRYNLASVDGYVLPDTPQNIVLAGSHNAVPTIISTTSLEQLSTVVDNNLQNVITSDAAYLFMLQLTWPQKASDIFQLYPSSDYGNSPLLAYIVATDDIIFQCPKRNMLNILSRSQSAPVWSALWTHWSVQGPFQQKPASHASDIPYWFQAYAPTDLTDNEKILAYFMSATLWKFAGTHDPSSTYVPWPAYQPTATNFYVWDLLSSPLVGTNYRESQCASLEQIGFSWEYFQQGN